MITLKRFIIVTLYVWSLLCIRSVHVGSRCYSDFPLEPITFVVSFRSLRSHETQLTPPRLSIDCPTMDITRRSSFLRSKSSRTTVCVMLPGSGRSRVRKPWIGSF